VPIEVWIVIAAALALVGFAIAATAAPWTVLLGAGGGLIALGLLAGVPASMRYHLALRRVFLRRGDVSARWWMAPTSLHGRLDEDERRVVMPPFRLGVAAFVVMLCGCALATMALVSAWSLGTALE
jgi:hypothetical protein